MPFLNLKNRLLLILLAFGFHACVKTERTDTNSGAQSEIQKKVESWMETKISHLDDETWIAKIRHLKKSLLFAKLQTEDMAGGARLLAVPLNTDFSSKNNAGKRKVSTAVFILDKDENIGQIEIVEFIPDNGNLALPLNAIKNLYSYRNPNLNGLFTFANIVDEMTHSYGYQDGQIISRSELQKKADGGRRSSNLRSDTDENCIDWYMVTTYYDDYGRVLYQDREYRFTTCGGCTVVPCPKYEDRGGGGGGTDESSAISVKSWTAYASPNGYNKVNSTEWLYGVIAPYNGNRFTSVSYQDDGVVNQFRSDNVLYATWYRSNWTKSVTSKAATTTLTGTVRWNNDPNRQMVNVNSSKPWSAATDLY